MLFTFSKSTRVALEWSEDFYSCFIFRYLTLRGEMNGKLECSGSGYSTSTKVSPAFFRGIVKMSWDKRSDFGGVECVCEDIWVTLIEIQLLVRDDMWHEENASFSLDLSMIYSMIYFKILSPKLASLASKSSKSLPTNYLSAKTSSLTNTSLDSSMSLCTIFE